MRAAKLFVAAITANLAVLCLPANSFAAGIQALTVPAEAGQPPMSGAVWYPCAVAPVEIRLGPYVVNAARDCPVEGTRLPLIVISHGRGGSFLGHRDTAQALADAGFIVAAISHPGDSSQDSSATNAFSTFVQRPAQMRRLVDYLLGAWPSAGAIDPQRIGLFGFSRGGYTGLVDIGAVPVFPRDLRMCADAADEACAALRQGRLAVPSADVRIKAAVIADPLDIFFGPASFQAVRIPVQLWRSELGGDGVTPARVAAIAAALPDPHEDHVVPAGHFAFLPPCPAALLQSAREICMDVPGFDRAGFHEEFNRNVVAFFRRWLP